MNWKGMMAKLPGRSDLAIKNRWRLLTRQSVSHDQGESPPDESTEIPANSLAPIQGEEPARMCSSGSPVDGPVSENAPSDTSGQETFSIDEDMVDQYHECDD
jgi:hypothetical protein